MAEEGGAAPAPAGKEPYNPDPYKLPPPGENGGGCCNKSDPHKKAEPHKCPTSIDRHYTDCLALILLILCWVVTTGVGVSAIEGTLLAKCGANSDQQCEGNARALMAPTDYKGRMCGVDSAVSDKPYGYLVSKYGEMVCVDECPTKSVTPDFTESAYDNLKDYCMTSKVASGYKTATYLSTKGQDYSTLLGTSADGSTYLEGPCMFGLASFELGYYCAFNPDARLPSVPGFPYSNKSVTGIFTDGASATSYLADFMSDLVVSRNAVFGFGFAVALLVAFIYSYLMTLGMVDCVVWSCILITFALFFCLGGYMYYTYQQWDAANCDIADDVVDDDSTCTGVNVAHSDNEISGMMYVSYVFFGISALWVAFIICICSKIRLACAFVRVAGTAVRDMPIVLFFPIAQIAGLLLFLLPWMYYMAYVQAQGLFLCENECHGCADDDSCTCNGMKDGKLFDCSFDEIGTLYQANETKYTWEWADASIGSDQDLAASWMMFSYFWTSQFIVAMGQLVMAMTFVLWYFAGFDSDQEEQVAVQTAAAEGETIEPKKKVSCCWKMICGDPDNYRGNGLFFKGLHLVLYHVGTAAAGSLVIAIIQFIRYMVAKIQAQCNRSLTGTAKTIANIVLCCIQCCLYCLEKCMKFINKHAYIITAVKGSSFCVAACASFWLIVRNIRLIAALTMVQEFSIIIGKMLIVMCTGALSYMYMQSVTDAAGLTLADQTNSLIGPTLFVMILAYFIADMFLNTYSMAMDCMMHCYLSDKEANSPMWATNEKATHLKPLAAVIGKNAPKEKATENNPVNNGAE